MQPVNVLCMKWGNKYSADYVNKLCAMVARHLSLPHRFVCLTDDPKGLAPAVEHFPIPPMPVDVSGPERGWTKILTFSTHLYDLHGPCLFLDLDLIIVDSLDEFFYFSGDVLIIRDWLKKDGTGNSSVYRFDVGQHGYVLEAFVERWPALKKQFRNEQEFISAILLRKKALHYWPAAWCQSFKRHCVPRFPRNFWREPILPAQARIVVFHGFPQPHEAMVGRSGKWYRYMLPTTWIERYWG